MPVSFASLNTQMHGNSTRTSHDLLTCSVDFHYINIHPNSIARTQINKIQNNYHKQTVILAHLNAISILMELNQHKHRVKFTCTSRHSIRNRYSQESTPENLECQKCQTKHEKCKINNLILLKPY